MSLKTVLLVGVFWVLLFGVIVAIIVSNPPKVFIADDKDCLRECVLASSPSRSPEYAAQRCAQVLCRGHWEAAP